MLCLELKWVWRIRGRGDIGGEFEVDCLGEAGMRDVGVVEDEVC